MEVRNIEKKDIQLPNVRDSSKLAFVLLNVFTPEECQQWIDITENHGYKPALINMGTQQISIPDVRNNDRCIIDDASMAKVIFDRIKAYLPTTWKEYYLVGLNERLRFLRYDRAQKFKAHYDGEYHRDDGSNERSYITVQLYLNEGFDGGETTFISKTPSVPHVPCVPLTGMVLIFQHDILHEGSELRKGRKYTVRTDVMYGPNKQAV